MELLWTHTGRRTLARTESRCRSISCRRFRQPSRSTKTRSPTTGIYCQPDQIIQRAKASLIVLRDGFAEPAVA